MTDRRKQLDNWLSGYFEGDPFTLEPASTDASFRHYYRVCHDEEFAIVMDAPPGQEDCKPFIDVAARLRSAGVNTPVIKFADTDLGFILMTDFGTRLYLDMLNESSADKLYADAITALLAQQSGAATDKLPRYDRELLRTEMQLFMDWLVVEHLQLDPDANTRLMIERVFDILIGNALEQPQVFVHRDYHSRNLMLTAENNPGVLDFQDAVHGPVSYDLVSLLRDCYIEWPADQIGRWVDSYIEQAVDAGILAPSDRQKFVRWFDLMGIQRHFKAAGIFARLLHRDGKPGYIKDIPRTLGYVVAVSKKYSEFAEIGDFIAETVLPALERKLATP